MILLGSFWQRAHHINGYDLPRASAEEVSGACGAGPAMFCSFAELAGGHQPTGGAPHAISVPALLYSFQSLIRSTVNPTMNVPHYFPP